MISIIVPVYNVKEYLNRCVDSVLNQLYPYWELLLIDDGSMDGSSKMCDNFARIDTRIKVYHKTNGGVSSARNLGLCKAKGEYITFLDSDDYLALDTLSELDKILTNDSGIDIIDFPYTFTKTSNKNGRIVSSHNKVLYKGEASILNYWFRNPRFESCARLFSKKVIGDNQFPVGVKVGEDTIFFFSCLIRCSNYYVTDMGMYYYYMRDDSVMNTLSVEDSIQADCIMFDTIRQTDIYDSSYYCSLLYRVLFSKIDLFSYKEKIESYQVYINELRWRKIICKNNPIKVLVILGTIKVIGLSCFLHIYNYVKCKH